MKMVTPPKLPPTAVGLTPKKQNAFGRFIERVLIGTGLCVAGFIGLIIAGSFISGFKSNDHVPLKRVVARAKTPEERAEMEQRWQQMTEAREKSRALARAKVDAEAEARERARAAAQSEEELAQELISISIKAVKGRLKSPSTAKFPGTVFGRHEFKLYSLRADTNSFRVFSWVDAQNSFGATMRSQWAVTLKKVAEHWDILNVTVE